MKLLYCLSILIFGIMLGGAGVWWYCRGAMIEVKTNAIMDLTRQKLQDAVVGMTLVRKGETSEFLASGEQDLNTYIYGLTFLTKEFPYERTNRVYDMIARYRTEHPYESGEAEIDEKVQQFLSK
jgi:hypothetical protein